MTKSSLQHFLADGRLRRQAASAHEIADLLAVADRDAADARIPGVARDRRFATAYNAALQLLTIVATEREIDELTTEVARLRTAVIAWLAERHPGLALATETSDGSGV